MLLITHEEWENIFNVNAVTVETLFLLIKLECMANTSSVICAAKSDCFKKLHLDMYGYRTDVYKIWRELTINVVIIIDNGDAPAAIIPPAIY